MVGSAARAGRRAGPGCSRHSAISASRQHRQRTGSRRPRSWPVGLRRSRGCAGSGLGRTVGRPTCRARAGPAVGDGCDAAWSRARQQRSRPPPDGSGLLPGCGSSRELATGRLPDRGKAACDPRCGVVRVGLLVGGPSGGTPGESLVHPLHRRAGRSPARISRTDAPRGRADDPGHPRLRPQRFVQPAVGPHAGAAVLRDVPGSQAVAAFAGRGDRRGRVLRPV